MNLFRNRSNRATAADDTAAARTEPALPHMQIVAHTDDDLYFMVPDLLHTVRAGIPVVCVYITAGEADGRNAPTSDKNRDQVPVDFEGYTAGRQNGLRAAYSSIVTGGRDAVWKRETRTFRDGVVGEINTLDEGPAPITLIYLNLRMVGGDAPVRLRTLWTEESPAQPTLRPTGSPIPGESGSYNFTREGLIGTLTDLLAEYGPSVVRVLDPDPDHTSYGNGPTRYCDNEDHTASALFALAALRRYDRAGHPQKVSMESYRGYWNKLWPFNLSGPAFAEKMKYISIYGGGDGHACETPLTCGDRQLGNRAYNRGYGQSTTYRYQGTTNWFQQQADGRLVAFAVLDGRPVRWTESLAATYEWGEPAPLGTLLEEDDTTYLPQLDVVRDPQGCLHVLGLRMGTAADQYSHTRDVVHTWQGQPSSVFGPWNDLGNPYNPAGNNGIKRRELGNPAAAFDGEGQLLFVVRNFGHGLSARRRLPGGLWSNWLDFGGRSQDGYGVVTTREGSVELYGGSVGDGIQPGVVRWRQAGPEGTIAPEYDTLLPAPAGPPAVLEQPDGRLLLLVRQPQTAWVVAYRQAEPGGAFDTRAHLLGGDGGFGRLATLLLPSGELLVAQRNDGGTVSVTVQPTDGGDFHTEWHDLGGGPFLHLPALALDHQGRPVLALIGSDSRLRTTCLEISGRTVRAGAWQSSV
ncbi:PIG-L family deacetylase [Kitasatospora sp. NPDC002227]|uniref:PIG-L family deacetylase n=1 Tax=Kitasatospora sp. NPDC002227 TaxID=3154773 RepID=UPI003321EA59